MKRKHPTIAKKIEAIKLELAKSNPVTKLEKEFQTRLSQPKMSNYELTKAIIELLFPTSNQK